MSCGCVRLGGRGSLGRRRPLEPEEGRTGRVVPRATQRTDPFCSMLAPGADRPAAIVRRTRRASALLEPGECRSVRDGSPNVVGSSEKPKKCHRRGRARPVASSCDHERSTIASSGSANPRARTSRTQRRVVSDTQPGSSGLMNEKDAPIPSPRREWIAPCVEQRPPRACGFFSGFGTTLRWASAGIDRRAG